MSEKKQRLVLTISGNIVDILHQPHGLGEEGGPRQHSGHPGFLFPSGSTSRGGEKKGIIV